jgi:hypothetical protein
MGSGMKKIAALIVLGVLSIGRAIPVSARTQNSAMSESRAAQKANRKQQKAQRKYAKAQRKAERKMLKTERKNTRYPSRQY